MHQTKDPCINQILQEMKGDFAVIYGLVCILVLDTERTKLAVPSHLVILVIRKAHDSELVARGGIQKTCHNLRSYSFPSYRKTIE
jgi:phage-related baseplate assembly protein